VWRLCDSACPGACVQEGLFPGVPRKWREMQVEMGAESDVTENAAMEDAASEDEAEEATDKEDL
jgi:hypothetical protein